MNNERNLKTIQNLWLSAGQAYKEKREVDYILWEVTHRCNLKCIHCRAAASPSLKEHDIIQGEDALNLLGEIRKMERPTLVFTGGEPLLRKDLLQIVNPLLEQSKF